MKALGRVWRGESKCAYCGESTGGWSNRSSTCRRHRSMDYDIMGRAGLGGRKMRGHNAMPAKAHRQLNRRLEPPQPRDG